MKHLTVILTLLCWQLSAAQSMHVHKNSGVETTPLNSIDSITFAGSGQAPPSRLAVLWTSGDPEVADKVCFMYTANAHSSKWFDEVLLIVWGPSSKLLSENQDLQSQVRAMLGNGMEVQACKACADAYGVSSDLEALGIEVKYMGVPLSNMLQSGWKVLTF